MRLGQSCDIAFSSPNLNLWIFYIYIQSRIVAAACLSSAHSRFAESIQAQRPCNSPQNQIYAIANQDDVTSFRSVDCQMPFLWQVFQMAGRHITHSGITLTREHLTPIVIFMEMLRPHCCSSSMRAYDGHVKSVGVFKAS